MKKMRATGCRPVMAAVTVCMLVMLCGCVRDFYSSPPADETADGVRLDARITVHTPETGGVFSAPVPADETVESIYALLMLDGRVHSVAEGKNITPAGVRQVTFDVSFSIETQNSGKGFGILLLANLPSADFPFETVRNDWRNKTREELENTLAVVTRKNPESDDVKPPLVMYGETDTPVSPGTDKNISIRLLRSVAKVEMTVSEDVLTSVFEHTETYIFKASNKYAAIPKKGGSGTVLTIPEGQGELKFFKAETKEAVYIPESKVVFGSSDATGDAHHTERCAIVVGGKYKGSSTTNSYYRIDFSQTAVPSGAEEKKLMDVLRNHRYKVVITSVGSMGESTPEEAYRSVKNNISAGIIEWDDNNMDIVFDGENWASVERKKVVFADGEGIQSLVEINSNVAPSQWKMKFGSNTFSSDTELTGTHFYAKKPADKPVSETVQGGNLLIKTLAELPEFTGTKPDPDKPGNTIPDPDSPRSEPRHETLTIGIGRLEIIISLTQNPYSPNGWTDGGEYEGGL